jgi:hypothetical protein
MLKVIMHGLLARKFRLVATALAVTLGVAFMAGTLVLTDTFGQTFNDLSAGVYKGTDAGRPRHGRVQRAAVHRRAATIRQCLVGRHPQPGSRRGRRRRQRVRVHQADREGREGAG